MVDFPSFCARYPFIDTADESVDGGVADKIGDDDHVSFIDRSVLRWWREVVVLFRFMMLVSFGGRLVRCSVRGLLRDVGLGLPFRWSFWCRGSSVCGPN